MDLVIDRKRFALLAAALACALAALLSMSSAADAAEALYWDNYADNAIVGANIDGSGAAPLNVEGAGLTGPEGLALDVPRDRVLTASYEGGPGKSGQIVFARMDGAGGGVLNTSGAPVDAPQGVAIDPSNGTIYWANDNGGPEAEGSIGWARLDGSGGGELNTSGATVSRPERIAVDVVHGRVYWVNSGSEPGKPETISFANANNAGGGGDLDPGSATPPTSAHGIVVDPAANRVYWINPVAEVISFASLSGGGGGDLSTTRSAFDEPYGLAFDPSIRRLYWGNYGNGTTDPQGAIGFLDLAGTGGGIDISGAPVHGPQDPVVYKPPIAAGAPAVSGALVAPASLGCSAGTWADFPGSFVYATPKSYAYSWSLNGAPIAGATGNVLTAAAPGRYACTVTATNDEGSASQSSAAVVVAAPSSAASPAVLELGAMKKAKLKPGWTGVFRVTATNVGGQASPPAKLCATLTRKAKKGLKAPRCANLAAIAAGGTGTATLRVKVRKSAKNGAYKLTLALEGATGNTVTTKVIVKGAKKHHKHHKRRK